MAEVEIRPVGADQLTEVGQVFSPERATRHCWCMAFCSTGRQFAAGWYGGGNRRRFESMAVSESSPMGVLAVHEGQPVGWCACGPRARYKAALAGRSSVLSRRPAAEDDHVWLIACIIVPPDRRGSGVVVPLLRGAISLALASAAPAIEAWPLAHGVRRPAMTHVGRERVFARLGFVAIERPSAERVLMRLEAVGTPVW